jgi:hypothetical protein
MRFCAAQNYAHNCALSGPAKNALDKRTGQEQGQSMNLWMLLMAISLIGAMVSGWLGGESGGVVGILIGMLIGLFAGAGSVWSMYLAERRFVPWITAKKMQIQAPAFVGIHLLGLSWCLVTVAAAYFITRLLVHQVVA